MSFKAIFIVLILAGVCFINASGQIDKNLRSVRVAVSGDTISLDTLLLAPGSVHIEGMDSGSYFVDNVAASIYFKQKPAVDSVTVHYRVLYSEFLTLKRHKDPKLRMLYQTENPFSYVPAKEKYIYNDDELNTIGNISRGIGFGNRQDVVVNSNLNLRINGKINNKVDVLAAVSDQNNPIQPEGNTQQLQDFDRVFIQLSQDSTSLTVGDFPMSRPHGSYFMNYNKKSRGLQLQHVTSYGKGLIRLSAEGAVSRGRFSRNTFQGTEGNQGPYRLKGTNGEIFIIVISGTEKVYLDGEIMQRGEQNDYIVDYNTGEIIFTPNRLITRYSRIVVEFQYSDRNYARSVVRMGGEYVIGKWTLNGNYFTEQDNRNQPFQQSLDGFDSLSNKSAREVLAEAGDVRQAYIQRVSSTKIFNPSRIMYVRRDSLGQKIFVYANDPKSDTLFYEVSFSYVGAGNGNYRQKLSNANGKVFEFIAPVAGIMKGDYEPVEVLITPNRHQMATFGGKYEISEGNIVSFELATTINDINTFSDLDAKDDNGYGAFFRFNGSHLPKTSKWQLQSDVSYEFIDKNFVYVERYRDVEFDRSWNRKLENPDNLIRTKYNENVIRSSLSLHRKKTLGTRYQFALYDRSGLSTGIQHQGEYFWRDKRNDFMVKAEQLSTGTPVEISSAGVSEDSAALSVIDNSFMGYLVRYKRSFRWIEAGGQYSSEQSNYIPKGDDSLLSGSFHFNAYEGFIKNNDSMRFQYRLGYSERNDYQPDNSDYKLYTVGRDLSYLTAWKGKKNGDFRLTGIYRQLDFKDSLLSLLKPENTLQGRVEVNFNALRKVVRTQFFYQLGTGQEQRREFTYIRVGDGNGTYIWNDYDSNGVQSLNEFEYASDLDIGRANFIRQFLPTQDFIKSYSNQFNHSIRVNPAIVWRNQSKGVKRFLSRFSNLNTVRIEKKVTDNDYKEFLNPFAMNVDDSALISTTSAIRNAVFFNQSDPKFGMDFNYLQSTSKIFLISGFDSRENIEYGIKGRWNITRSWSVVTEATSGNRSYTSEFLSDRSFDYDYISVEPRLEYQFKQKLRTSLIYKQSEAENKAVMGGENAVNKDISFEFRWNAVNRGNIRTSFGYVHIDYNGDPSSPLTYELLQGLQNGTNFKWLLQAEYRFPNNIQLLINYDGRKSEKVDVIHIGRLQLRYLF